MSQCSMTVAVLGKGSDHLIRNGQRGRVQGEICELELHLER